MPTTYDTVYDAGTANSGLITTAGLNLLTTELNALPNNGCALSQVGGGSSNGLFTNNDTAQAIWGVPKLTLGGALTTALNSGAYIAGWFLESLDGTSFEYGTTTGNPSSGSTTLGSLGTISGIYYNSTTPSQSDYVFDLTTPGNLAVGTYVNSAPSGASLTLSTGALASATGDILAFMSPPARPPDFVFAFQAQVYMANQVIIGYGGGSGGRLCRLPSTKFRTFIQSQMGTSGGTIASSGNIISVGPIAPHLN